MISIAFRIKCPVYEFSTGDKTGFKISFEKPVKNPMTNQKERQRYTLTAIAPSQSDADFYRKSLIYGAVVHAFSEYELVLADNRGESVINLTYARIIDIFQPESEAKRPISIISRRFDYRERESQIAYGRGMKDD